MANTYCYNFMTTKLKLVQYLLNTSDAHAILLNAVNFWKDESVGFLVLLAQIEEKTVT